MEEGGVTSYPRSTPMTLRDPLSWTKRRLSRYYGGLAFQEGYEGDWGRWYLFQFGLGLRHLRFGGGFGGRGDVEGSAVSVVMVGRGGVVGSWLVCGGA